MFPPAVRMPGSLRHEILFALDLAPLLLAPQGGGDPGGVALAGPRFSGVSDINAASVRDRVERFVLGVLHALGQLGRRLWLQLDEAAVALAILHAATPLWQAVPHIGISASFSARGLANT